MANGIHLTPTFTTALVTVVVVCSVPALSQKRPSPPTVDPVIESARKAASQFTGSLPKYLVRRTTTRYESVRPTCSIGQILSDPNGCGSQAIESWKTLDVVTADVVTENGKELDLNIRLNGSPATEKEVDLSGSWSVGDFAGTLQAILSQESAAQFTKKRTGALLKHPAYRYEYSIDQPHSSWHLYAGTSDYSPAYDGEIWFDQQTSRVLRVVLTAEKLPASFPMNKVEWSVDYDFVKIGAGMWLLPKHSETQNCQRNNAICSRNATDFQNYREYSADSSVTFDEPTQ